MRKAIGHPCCANADEWDERTAATSNPHVAALIDLHGKQLCGEYCDLDGPIGLGHVDANRRLTASALITKPAISVGAILANMHGDSYISSYIEAKISILRAPIV